MKNRWMTTGLLLFAFGAAFGDETGSVAMTPAAPAIGSASPQTAATGPAEGQTVLMDFKDASIDSVLVFLSDLLGLTFVRDDTVQGSVTVVNRAKMTPREAIQTLEGALSLKGFALVRQSEKVYQVLPAAKAATRGMDVRADRAPEGGDHFVSRVVKLRYTQPAAVLPVLEKLISADERVAPHLDSGSVVITAAAGNADRLMALIDALDVRASEGQTLEVVTINCLGTGQVQELLGRVYSGQAITDPGTAPQPTSYRVVPVPGRGKLVLVARPEQLAQLKSFIEQVDTPGLRDQPLKIYKLKVADAGKLAAFLAMRLQAPAGDRPAAGRPTSDSPAPTPAPAGETQAQGPLILADTVTNSLLVVASAEYQQVVAKLIRQLDYEGFMNAKTRVLELRNARAATLAEQLERIANRPGETPVALIADRRLNRLIATSANASRLDTVARLVKTLDLPGASEELVTHVHYLSHAAAGEIAKVLRELYPSVVVEAPEQGAPPSPAGEAEGSVNPPDGPPAGPPAGPSPVVPRAGPGTAVNTAGGIPGGTIRVVAHDRTNSLVILSTESSYEQIAGMLEKLDVDPLQVLVEVVIAEVQAENEQLFGMDLAFTKGQNNIRTDFDGMTAANGADTSLPGLRAFVVDDAKFRGLMRALHDNKRTNVLATPKLFANNNQEASILIGRQVPVITGRTVTTGGNTISTVEYKDVGTKLNILPQINRRGSVTLKIAQEVKTITGQGVEGNPILDTRETRTTVTVADGQAILLGGLLQDEQSRQRSHVPLLGEIPVVKWLVSSRDAKAAKRELVFMFKPRLVTGSAHASTLAGAEMARSSFRLQLEGGMPASRLVVRER